MAGVPVITVGKILDAQLMSEVVERGEVDGVVIGRALLADEEFVRKAMDERYEQIAPCTGCGIGCVGEQTKRHPATCVINPRAGREGTSSGQKQKNQNMCWSSAVGSAV
ncbi:MAG: hypothetical protein ACLVJ6_04180 [Merdibacter sp.]